MKPTASWKGRYQTCKDHVLSYSDDMETWTAYTPQEITAILFETYNQHADELQHIKEHMFRSTWDLYALVGKQNRT
jgi:hypothetical protein